MVVGRASPLHQWWRSRLLAGVVLLGVTVSAQADCTLTNTGNLPLPDAGYRTYLGHPAGLYPNYANQPPPQHLAAGLKIATNDIQPLDAAGQPAPSNGRIVLLSIGMSNTTQEWASKGTENFRALANADPAKNPRVLIVDGARGGQAATDWTNFYSPNWTNVEQRLSNVGATTNQVQVIWMKQARRQPLASGVFPAHAQRLQRDLETIMQVARSRYPNLKIAYISSRTRSYENSPGSLNPEPFAYEGAFATKWMVERQIGGEPSLNFDPERGPVMAPYISWGPYLWADGTVGRSDGLSWLCSDLESDFTHPSATGGVPKVGWQLLSFFKTNPTTTPWFLRGTIIGQPPVCVPEANVTEGDAPLTVSFSANASDPDGPIRNYHWNFDDGTSSTNANPTKVFKTPGLFVARLTSTDTNGNSGQGSVAITVRTTFDWWRTNKFTAEELLDGGFSGPTANPDFDPWPNLLEYATGQEPKVSNTALATMVCSNGVLCFGFPHLKAATDVSLVAEASVDLANWSPVMPARTNDLGPIESLIFEENLAAHSAKFYRLRASR